MYSFQERKHVDLACEKGICNGNFVVLLLLHIYKIIMVYLAAYIFMMTLIIVSNCLGRDKQYDI
jgi:hypothetical protein